MTTLGKGAFLFMALMISCGESPVPGATDFERAMQRAPGLGEFLRGASDEASAFMSQTGASVPQAFAEVFGQLQDKSIDGAGWLVVAGAFKYFPGQCNNLDDAVAVSGSASIVTPLVAFYEYTIVDTATGAIYQSFGQVSAGCDTGSVDWYGPLVPPVTATVIGDFSAEERGLIADQIQDGFGPGLGVP